MSTVLLGGQHMIVPDVDPAAVRKAAARALSEARTLGVRHGHDVADLAQTVSRALAAEYAATDDLDRAVQYGHAAHILTGLREKTWALRSERRQRQLAVFAATSFRLPVDVEAVPCKHSDRDACDRCGRRVS